MTITTVIAALQTINAAVTDVDNAPTDYPSTIEAADLPMVIVWPGAVEAEGGMMGKQAWRRYQIILYVKPAGAGRGISEGWNETKTMLQNLLEAYLNPDNHQLNVAGIYNANIIPDRASGNGVTDGGFEIIAWPPPATGTEGFPHYFGAQLQVTIKETW